MHPSCNINTSTNNLNDPSSAFDDYYCYNYSSPFLFPSSPSLYHQYYIHDSDNNSHINIETDFFQDFLENNHETIQPQQHNTPLENNNNNINENNYKENFQQNKSKRVCYDKISSPRKKISKKDRHTKIETAQGPRDRRMRLSLNVARKFFDLQDMLGLDKASKTVEWLLTKSISSISELSRSFQHQVGANSSVSSTSEILMDELLLSSSHGNLKLEMPDNKNSESNKANKKVVRTIRPLARKLREEARKRARERTKEKMSNLKKRRELSGIPDVGYGTSLGNEGFWIQSSTFLDLQQDGGTIHGHSCFSDIEDLSGNLGEASLW